MRVFHPPSRSTFALLFRKTSLLFSYSPFFALSLLPSLPFSVEWTTRYLHIASALCHGGSGAVCAASHLPIGPVWSLFSGAPAHRGASLRSESLIWWVTWMLKIRRRSISHKVCLFVGYIMKPISWNTKIAHKPLLKLIDFSWQLSDLKMCSYKSLAMFTLEASPTTLLFK